MTEQGINWFRQNVCTKCEKYTVKHAMSCPEKIMELCIEAEKVRAIQDLFCYDSAGIPIIRTENRQ